MIPHKLGRNDPCWCGSGIKYKRCHLNRESEKPVAPWEASREFRQTFAAKTCLAPEGWLSDCSKTVARAHTVPRAGSLRHIARDGHVYSFVPSLEKLKKHHGVCFPELRGINRASTFNGFCSKHDDEIFAAIEKQPFSATPEQCFLLGYRELAREIYTKRAAASLTDLRRSMDRGKPLEAQLDVQALNSLIEIGVAAGLSDNAHYKSIYDEVLQSQDFSEVRYYVIEVEGAPDVMCSGAMSPEQDFDGLKLQNARDLTTRTDLLSFTSFFGGNAGAIVFVWTADSDQACERLIESLHTIDDTHVTAALLRLFFEHCENVHMRPDWWEGLKDGSQQALVHRMAASMNPWISRPDAILADDGLQVPSWKVLRRIRNHS